MCRMCLGQSRVDSLYMQYLNDHRHDRKQVYFWLVLPCLTYLGSDILIHVL